MFGEIQKAVRQAVKSLFGVSVEVEITRPDEQFGDYATNVALQLAGKLNKNPRDIAEQLAGELRQLDSIAEVAVAGPGFLNIYLTNDALAKSTWSATELAQPFKDQVVVVEYSDPNPFKVLHVGHLYTSVVGDAIAKLFEAAGASTHRVNFGGDVGLHVARTMWAIVKELDGERPEKLEKVAKGNRPKWMADAYVKGNEAYEDDEDAKKAIIELNKKIYALVDKGDRDSPLAKIYWTCRQWSYDYFEEFYKLIGSGFEKYYPESQTIELGLKAVKQNMGKVFEQSNGAVVFKGEVHNLHTRVFINSQGLPTYETKDVGLILKKWQDFHFDKSIVITGNEIYEYMQVVLKAVEQFAPDLVQKTTHVTHGLVKLSGGQKMSSRKGNIIGAAEVIDIVEAAAAKISQKKDTSVTLGAIKYGFLKNRIGSDFIFDPVESVSLQGSSGPYLLYAHARARSILDKAEARAEGMGDSPALSPKPYAFNPAERNLARKISEYPEVVARATDELLPSHVATYLYELAQVFNSFYEQNRVIGDARQELRLKLVEAYADVLKNGLNLLNISAPEKM